MKRHVLVLVLIFAVRSSLWSQLLTDDFDGLTPGNLGTQNGWVQNGSGLDAQVADISPITYPGYNGGGDEYLTISSVNGIDPHHTFANQTTTVKIWYSFIMNLTSFNGTGDYFLSLRNSGNTNYLARLYVKNNSGVFQLGTSKGSGAPLNYSGSYSYGTTYLVLARYDWSTTASSDDNFYVWVNPVVSAEPATGSATYIIEGGTDPSFGSAINSIMIHQRSTTNTPPGRLDGFRVSANTSSTLGWMELNASPSGYYAQSSGPLNLTTSWGHKTNGNGSPPPNFSDDSRTYYIHNNSSPSTNDFWTISGVNSKLIIGDGLNQCTFTAPHNIAVQDLDISPNGAMTLNSGKVLSVNGTFTLKSNATGTGSFLSNGTYSGSAKVECYISQYTNNSNGWHFLSSPVGSFAVSGSTFEPVSGDDDLFWYDEANNLWINWLAGNFDFGTDRGYLCAYKSSSVKHFTGTLNSNDNTIANLSFNASQGEGWHLIPNPFPCAFIWNSLGMSATGYVSTASAKILNGGSTYTDITDGDPVPAMNSFFMQVSSGINSITIPASSRAHDSQSWYKNSSAELLMLTVRSMENDYYQENMVRFLCDATEDFDIQFDSPFMAGMAGTPQLFSCLGSDMRLSLNSYPTLSGSRVVPIGFIKGSSHSYTINVSKMENIGNHTAIILEDKRDGKVHDLRESQTYTFNSSDGDDPNRFLLHFNQPNAVSENMADKPFSFYGVNNSIYITHNSDEKLNGNVFVYNLMGQFLIQHRLNDDKLIKLHLNVTQGYYLVKVITVDSSYSGKVFLR